jgi:hypothetical protein
MVPSQLNININQTTIDRASDLNNKNLSSPVFVGIVQLFIGSTVTPFKLLVRPTYWRHTYEQSMLGGPCKKRHAAATPYNTSKSW